VVLSVATREQTRRARVGESQGVAVKHVAIDMPILTKNSLPLA
jgi:hypothetical protein